MILACVAQRSRWLAAGAAFLVVCFALASRASAAADPNDACWACHGQPGLTTKLASGEVLSLSLDPAVFAASKHGQAAKLCTDCHTNITGYPHPALTAPDRRSFQLERYTQCKNCHPTQYQETRYSMHARDLAAGMKQAAVCTDCHGSHDIGDPIVPRSRASQTCQKCHSTIYALYAASVHGKALTANDPNVPVCTDCHGAHTQADPTTVQFRLKSPELCASCHADAKKMTPYGISTDVMNTYVADFHGTTITLFEKQSPDQPSNKAVCTDCHGVHFILSVDESTAAVAKQNLLRTCQACHPDATTNFSDSWVGHFPPSPTRNALVYYVNLFYQILIPTVIGGMLLYVLLDATRRIINRFQHKGG